MFEEIDQVITETLQHQIQWLPLDQLQPATEFSFQKDPSFDQSNAYFCKTTEETLILPAYVVFIPDRDSFVIQYSLHLIQGDEYFDLAVSQRKLFELRAAIDLANGAGEEDFFNW